MARHDSENGRLGDWDQEAGQTPPGSAVMVMGVALGPGRRGAAEEGRPEPGDDRFVEIADDQHEA